MYASFLAPGMVVYDVGANVGFLAVLAARLVGPTGRAICFEPLQRNAEAIRHNAALNSFRNITVIPQALGTEDSTADFLVSDDVGWGCLAGGKEPPEPTGEVLVEVRSLRTAIQEHGLPAPDLIKIDIEGGEVAMLEGSRDVLRKFRPMLLIELHGTNGAVDAVLKDLGYSSSVVGSDRSIVEAPWDAFVIAVSLTSPERCEKARALAMAATATR